MKYDAPLYEDKIFDVDDVIMTSGEGDASIDDGSSNSNWSQFL